MELLIDSNKIEILAQIGTILQVAVCLSIFPALLRVNKTKNLDEISHSFLLLLNINSLTWVVFSTRTEEYRVLAPNIINLVISIIFLFWYHRIDGSFLWYLCQYSVIGVLFLNFTIKSLTEAKLGLFAVGLSLACYAAPIQQLKLVYKSKDHRFIDILVILACFVCSLIWWTYANLTDNKYVLIPNVVGFMCCVVQIGFYAWARSWIPSPLNGWSSKAKPLKEEKKLLTV